MKKGVLIVLFLQSIFMWAQITLPIQQSNIPKNHLVVNYDFSKGTSYSGIGATVTNLSNFSASDNATLVNTPSFSSSFGYIYLNGYNHYLLSPNLKPYFKSVTATNLQDSHTLSLWICPVASSGVVVNELGSTDINSGFRDSQIEMVNGYVKYRVYPAGESDIITSLSTIALNQWHHIAMVYDGATAKGYVDGVLQGTKTYARTNPINNNTNLHYSIGAPCVTHMGSGAAGNFFLAQFKMYNIPLTGTDIMQEFTRENTNFQNKWIPTSESVFSPSTNSNPTYWSTSSVWPAPVADTFNESSPYKLHYTPWLNSAQGWSAQANNTNQHIILNYLRPTTIAGIVTQGRANNGNQWVSKANVDVSIDGSTWVRVLTNVALNYDSINNVTVLFPTTVYAKYVKVIPTDWAYHITMRLGMIIKSYEPMEDNLALHLNPGNTNSYSGSGTTITDLSGNGLNGAISNLTYSNASFTFNGTNSQVNIPDNAALEPGTGSCTIEVWFKNSGTSGTVIGKYNAGGNASEVSYALRLMGSGSIRADFGNGSTAQITDNYSFAANTWVQMVYVWDKSNNQIYTYSNGLLKQTKAITISGGILNATTNLYLGSYNGGEYSQYFSGQMGIVRLYKKALNATEVQNNYNSNKALYGL